MVHLLFGPEIRLMLEENNVAEIKAFLETLHPATAAEALAGDLDADQVWKILQHTAISNQAAIFEYFPIEWQVEMVEGTGREHMAHLIEKMSHDDRVELLRRLPPRVAENLLRLVDEADRRDIATLVRQGENTAGGLMTTDYAWLPPNLTATEALDRLRLQAPESETIYYIFVLDEEHRLLGVLSLRDLILAPRHALVRDMMETQFVSVRVGDDRDVVVKELSRYDLIAIPVVDENNRMVGIITHDDIIDVVVEEATEDAYRMGAVGTMEESYLEADFVTVWRKRAIWLACLFIAELGTFTAMAHFEESIAQLVVLGLFVPLCLSTGGNSGSQAATLITRAMALGHISLGQWGKVLRHEVFMGLALGLSLGCIGLLRGAATPEDTRRNPRTMEEPFEFHLPGDGKLLPHANKDTWEVPSQSEQHTTVKWTGTVLVTLPAGSVPEPVANKTGAWRFPEKSVIRTEAVSRSSLGVVIGLAVALICLWGTLIGAMLPLVFKRLGFDPGYASSPFVATFVDVTGIMIYFTIATTILTFPS